LEDKKKNQAPDSINPMPESLIEHNDGEMGTGRGNKGEAVLVL
jgi:hypothetical protein